MYFPLQSVALRSGMYCNYWRWLKRKLKQEGIELVSATHGFKFEAPDGKLRVADVLNSEGVVLLAKNYPTNRANDFLN